MSKATTASSVLLPKGMLAVSLAALCGTIVFNTFPLFLGYAADRFALSDVQIGFLGSSYMAAYSLLTLSALFWASRFRWRNAAKLTAAITMAMSLSLLRAATYGELVLIVVLFAAVSSVPQLIANAWIDGTSKPDSLFGVKGVFDLTAAALAMLALVVFFGVPDFQSLLIVYLSVFLISTIAAGWIPEPQQPKKAQIVTGSPAGWGALGILALHSVAMVGFWSFVERIGKDVEASSSSIGTIMSATMIVGIAGAASASFFAHRFGLRRSIVYLYFGVIGAIALFIKSDTLAAYGLAVLLFQYFWISLNVLQIAFVADADNHGGLVAIVSVGMTAGGAFGPAVAGYLRTMIGNNGLYTFTIAVSLLCVFLTWLVIRGKGSE